MKITPWIIAVLLVVAGCDSKSPSTGDAGSTTATTTTGATSKPAPETTATTASTGTTNGSTASRTATAGNSTMPPKNTKPAPTKPPVKSGATALKPPKTTVKTAPVQSAAGSYVLKQMPKNGEVDHYTLYQPQPLPGGVIAHINIKIILSYSNVTSSGFTRTTRITSLDPSDLISKVPASGREQLKQRLAAQSAQIIKASTVQTFTPSGRPTSIKIVGGPAGMKPPTETPGITLIEFPDHAVKIGDSWSSPSGPDEDTCTLIKMTEVNGQKVAVVSIVTTIAPSSAVKVSRTARFFVSNGLLQSSTTVQSETKNGKTLSATTEITKV